MREFPVIVSEFRPAGKVQLLKEGAQLFNLLLDPAEMYNIAEQNPEMIAELHGQLEQFSNETGAKLAVSK